MVYAYTEDLGYIAYMPILLCSANVGSGNAAGKISVPGVL